MAKRATAALAAGEGPLIADLVLAECEYVLESFYEVPWERVAELLRAAIALPSIRTVDTSSLLGALKIYETARLDFASLPRPRRRVSAPMLSFDRTIDRVIREPARVVSRQR